MTVSFTNDFNLDIGEIIEEAHEQAGLPGTSAQSYRTALRSLNLIQLEWSNLGINLWQVEEIGYSASGVGATEYLTAGTAIYNIAPDTISVLGAVIRIFPGTDNQIDYDLRRLSRPDYQNISNKLSGGRPTSYYINRKEIKDFTSSTVDQRSTFTLWPVPDLNSTYQLIYWRMKRMYDAGNSADQTVPVPDRFLPAYIATLASKVALKSGVPEVVARVPELENRASALLKIAMDEDRETAPLRIVPMHFRV